MNSLKHRALQALIAAEIIALSFFCGRLTAPEPIKEYPIVYDRTDIYMTAQNYLVSGSYSEEGLITALMSYENFDESVTREVIGRMDVDWQAEADEELEAYLNMTGNSEKQIREHLERDLFTKEQIDRAIEKADPDWHEQAERCADFLKRSGAEDSSLRPLLLERGFRPEDL